MTSSCSDSWSNRPRIVNDTSTVFGQFLLDFGMQFRVAGAAFGEVGDACCSAHCNDVSYVTDINHESHFTWQAQYLVRLEGDACCSAHCK